MEEAAAEAISDEKVASQGERRKEKFINYHRRPSIDDCKDVGDDRRERKSPTFIICYS